MAGGQEGALEDACGGVKHKRIGTDNGDTVSQLDARSVIVDWKVQDHIRLDLLTESQVADNAEEDEEATDAGDGASEEGGELRPDRLVHRLVEREHEANAFERVYSRPKKQRPFLPVN
eukprot:CAMPEP_0185762804 /NCGR_PEP_ID=MMETSP1174-20130828/21775_1 /TAXON_ID=35687 /ORGANISM="Dictyocha speculum, Strain CCMP1381" /LENGTH=117 /DNA_ID=CAMNT_0028444643 /DNA_START=337 /DNA_END=690 /DNA_ORIENTATION=-